MGSKIKALLLGLLGFLVVTTIDAWTLTIDTISAPFTTRFAYSATKYTLGIVAPICIWYLIAWKGRGSDA